jgi:cytochrome P450
MTRLLAPPPLGTRMDGIPGAYGLPYVGFIFQYTRDPLGMFQRRHQRYGPLSWGQSFGKRFVAVLGADLHGEVLVNRDEHFSNEGAWEFLIGPFFHRGLMLMDGEEHRLHRRVLHTAFTRERLRQSVDVVGEVTAASLAGWPTDGEVVFQPLAKQLTLDLATTLFMGEEISDQTRRVNRAFVDTVKAATDPIRLPIPGTRWHRGLHGRRVLQEWFEERIAAKRATQTDDLFSVLCHAEGDDGGRLSDADVINHMIFFMMAAHDTSTIALTSLVYYLARHPEWQDRLREESLALGVDAVTYDDLDRLPSLDLAFKEVLRLIPPVPALPREVLADTELDGRPIPAGTMLMLAPIFNHHSSEWWTDPATFDPERHQRGEPGHKFAYTPFGGGAHLCIGMHFGGNEVKAIMHQLLLRSRWQVEPGYVMPVDWTSLPVPRDGLPILVSPR